MGTFDLATRWSLDTLQYGLTLENNDEHLKDINEKLIEFEVYSISNTLSESELITVSQVIRQIESAESFYYCLTTEDIAPSYLTSLIGTISMLKSQVYSIKSNLQERLNHMSKIHFTDWSNNIKQQSLISSLDNHGKGNSKQENVISNFARETLSSLEDLYVQVRNNIRVKIDLFNEEDEVSFPEAIHLSLSHPMQQTRLIVFKELNKVLEKHANVFASIYNQMVGLRLAEAKIKDVNCLDESLKLNGISKQTIDTVSEILDSNLDSLTKYFKFKACDVGKDFFGWHELMTSSQKVSLQITFPRAVDVITKSLVNIDCNMSEFVGEAITKRWVDAKRRKTKPPGGFCAPFISEGESRISLNFDNRIDSARILAHELGHAWHFKQMKDIPSLRFLDDTLEMTLAETSSIFFETVMIDYLIQNTSETSDKKAILGEKIERSLNYLMSIRGAFLFEKKFYEVRKKGQLDANQIEELSIACQKVAYGNSLSEYEPFVWIKYVQFYQANTSFYNYPYFIGFLLSIGLLELAKKDKQFDRKFQEFLCETGKTPMELLVKKHFQIDLSQPSFWQQTVQRIIQDIELYNEIL